MASDRANMTHWYSVPRLVFIGIRVAVSTIFGEFADRRDVLAAARPLDAKEFDPANVYKADETEDFWLDYVADTGDGWDSTYAIARLLAASELKPIGVPDGRSLPRAKALVMGGDEVYPTPSEDDYRLKLIAPFVAASGAAPPPTSEPHLYAVPGNHDWYDGLTAFLNLFCWRQLPGPWSAARQGKRLGFWRTQQTRSYFALQLPHGWWLWGTDIQLTNYIDQAQMDFFEHIARTWMPADAKLILCAGVPDWVYADPSAPEKTFSHFSFVEGTLNRVGRNQRLAVILTGDSHHYSHYTEDDRHYITAGGGGAFLHPTHQLPDEITFKWSWPPPAATNAAPPAALPPGQQPKQTYHRSFKLACKRNDERCVFPDQATSRCLAWRNLAFAAINWDFTVAVGLSWILFAWELDSIARGMGTTLPSALTADTAFWPDVWAYVKLVLGAPWPLLMILALGAGYRYFADFKAKLAVGALHTLAQIIPVALATVALARWCPYSGLLIACAGIAGGVIGSTVMGLYLLICLNLTGRHWNEAFSSLRIKHYKNFLRLQIDSNGQLTIYPIGLEHVPKDRGEQLKNPELSPILIEPPIEIM
jgi:hypothetical protein